MLRPVYAPEWVRLSGPHRAGGGWRAWTVPRRQRQVPDAAEPPPSTPPMLLSVTGQADGETVSVKVFLYCRPPAAAAAAQVSVVRRSDPCDRHTLLPLRGGSGQ